MIKRYLRSGVMENGVVVKTEGSSPQGGNLSPLLANVYLNEFDQEFNKRGVPGIRETAGKRYEISGRDAETKGEQGEKSYGQCVCNTKF